MAILTRTPPRSPREQRGCRRRDLRAVRRAVLIMTIGWIAGTSVSIAEEALPSEYQVKAAFLINFPKYVDWPAEAFAKPNSPIVIAVLGETKVAEEIQKVIAGRTVNGREILLKRLASGEQPGICHILFIPAAEQRHSPDLLAKLKDSSVLTVGEDEPFARNGGIITFVLRNGNVRLDIDLTAARKAGVTISSRLLAVADVVKGKTN